MANTPARTGPRWGLYWFIVVVVAAATVGVMLLLQNIAQRKQEGRQTFFPIAGLTEESVDPAEWGKNFPRQYDSYKRTVDIERTRFGGSEAFQKLDDDPHWRVIFNGYPFGVDYREERGHAYMLIDQRETERVINFKQPGACLHCHASVTTAYADKGAELVRTGGGDPGSLTREDLIHKGFAAINPMPYADATKLVEHPVSCVDCHDPSNAQLRVTRPGFLDGIRVLAASDDPLPHLPSVERWRKGSRERPYDPNVDASRQELRTLACAQCHVEYYFKGDEKMLTYPWHNGVKAEQIESYYDEVGWKDWVHKVSGAPVLKAQHPEFELWSQGIHARSGVSCADCHMPYTREGAMKFSDHHVRSPMLNIARACQTCHNYPEDEIKSRVATIQARTNGLMDRGERAVVELIESIASAKEGGASDDDLKAARDLQRKAQWRLDFIAAENSMGFHAPQEAARILAEAIDLARQGQVQVLKRGDVSPGAPVTTPPAPRAERPSPVKAGSSGG